METLKLINNVFKLRIGFAITLCAIAGMAMTPGPALPVWKVALLALAVFLSSASAGAFNQYAERELDARMPRTANRPFVTGQLPANGFWLSVIIGILALSVVLAGTVFNAHVAFYVFLGAFFYGVVYTIWLKQRSAWNIVIGGLAGSFAVLAGAAAITPALSPQSIILALILFLWTPPHFWSLATVLHEEYAAAKVPMLPVVIGDTIAAKIILAHTLVLVTVSIMPVFYGAGLIYLGGAVIGGSLFLYKSVLLMRDPGPKSAMINFHASLIQLVLLLFAAIIDGWIHI